MKTLAGCVSFSCVSSFFSIGNPHFMCALWTYKQRWSLEKQGFYGMQRLCTVSGLKNEGKWEMKSIGKNEPACETLLPLDVCSVFPKLVNFPLGKYVW